MNVIVCIDDKNGMLFGGRRLSRDTKLYERVLEITKGGNLLMNEYSYKLFEDFSADNIKSDNSFLKKAKIGDYCFVENSNISEFIEDIEKVIVYRWNRLYPSDLKIDMQILEGKKLIGTFEFKGNSHDKINEEIYE